MKKKRGNQPITNKQKHMMVRQIEPYLKSGLSIRKACEQSGVPRSTFYDIMASDDDFADQIKRFQSYVSVVTMGLFMQELMLIYNKCKSGEKMDWQDLKFLMWFATNSRHCRDEFGQVQRNQLSVDPQAEISKLTKMIDAYATS